MRRIIPLALTVFLAACAGSAPAPEIIAPLRPAPAVVSGALVGRTSAELAGRFGTPQFQVREGPGLKLQWSSASCILDVYLYPPVGKSLGETAIHADARRPDGSVTDAARCADTIGVSPSAG